MADAVVRVSLLARRGDPPVVVLLDRARGGSARAAASHPRWRSPFARLPQGAVRRPRLLGVLVRPVPDELSLLRRPPGPLRKAGRPGARPDPRGQRGRRRAFLADVPVRFTILRDPSGARGRGVPGRRDADDVPPRSGRPDRGAVRGRRQESARGDRSGRRGPRGRQAASPRASTAASRRASGRRARSRRGSAATSRTR